MTLLGGGFWFCCPWIGGGCSSDDVGGGWWMSSFLLGLVYNAWLLGQDSFVVLGFLMKLFGESLKKF